MMMKTFKNLILLITVSFAGSLISCSGVADDNSTIPYVPVNVQLDLNDPRYLDLNPYGGYLILKNHGNKGIVIYHQFDDTYVCYDLICSYETSNPCNGVEIRENGFYMQCGTTVNGTFEECCGSKYLWDGFPASGPALFSLAQYAVYKNGNLLNISN